MLAAWLQRLDLLGGSFVERHACRNRSAREQPEYLNVFRDRPGKTSSPSARWPGQGADGLGALYDNARLVAGPTTGSSTAPLSSAPPSGVGQTDRAMNLVTQSSAATLLILVQGVRGSDA
jgi:hypothetical protein